MSDQAETNVLAFPDSEGPIDPEQKLVEVFNRVRADISSIQTIEEVLKLRSQAEALRVYAIQIKSSKETLDQIAETKVRAERRLGQLLALRPETRGGDRRSEIFQKSEDSTIDSEKPTLETLGVTRDLSSRSQAIADISDAQFEQRLEEIKEKGKQPTSSELLSFAKYLRRQSDREERQNEAAEIARNVPHDERIQIRHGDFREVLKDIPNGSVQLVLTDPVYRKENLPAWADLSAFAARVLKPGRLLAAYSGNYYLLECMKALSTHLEYVWTCPVIYRAFPDTIFRRRIKTYWKPVLLFSNGEYQPEQKIPWIHDLIEGDGVQKENHRWEQGVGEAAHLIEGLTYEGDLVVDPFLGSGTVAVAAKRLNRRFIGCDLKEEEVNTTLARLAEDLELQDEP